MVLKQIDIFADDRNNATISITFTTKEKSLEIEMYKIWVREELKESFEIIHYANLIHNGLGFIQKPKESDIMYVYQILFARKLWEVPTRKRTVVNNKQTLKIAPYRNFVEIPKDYFKTFVELETSKYIKRLKGEKELCN